MTDKIKDYDVSGAINYHYDQFPPAITDYSRLVKPISAAAAALARYDQMLKGMHIAKYYSLLFGARKQ